MSTESTIVVAIVLAVLIIAAGFGLITAAIGVFEDGTGPFKDNITTSQSSAEEATIGKPGLHLEEATYHWELPTHHYSL